MEGEVACGVRTQAKRVYRDMAETVYPEKEKRMQQPDRRCSRGGREREKAKPESSPSSGPFVGAVVQLCSDSYETSENACLLCLELLFLESLKQCWMYLILYLSQS